MDLLREIPQRIWPVGRLDMDSEGLLLLTNDGSLTERLLHPRHEIEKVTTFGRRAMCPRRCRGCGA